jgi:hypothetical protein
MLEVRNIQKVYWAYNFLFPFKSSKVVFKDRTQSLLSLAHVINSNYK